MMASSGSKLSEEQKKRIEENRRKALERRNQRRQINAAGSQTVSVTGTMAKTNCAETRAVKSFSITGQNVPLFQDCTVKARETKNSISSKLVTTRFPNQIQPEDKNSRDPKTADNICRNTSVNICSTTKFYSTTSKDTTLTTDSNHSRTCTSLTPPTDSIYQMKRKKHDNNMVKSKHSTSVQFKNFSLNEQGGREVKQLSSITCAAKEVIKGSCVLTSRTRFSVNVGYHAQLIGVFKTIKSRSYDANSTTWSFALEDYKQLMSTVKCLSPNVVIDELPKAVFSVFAGQRPGTLRDLTADKINLNSIDSKLVGTLLPFQKEGVSFGVRHDGRVIIADDMGLGKTIQAICIASYYRAEWPLLVIAPSSVRLTWAQAFKKWLPSLDPQYINIVLTGKDNPTCGLVNIISYDLLSKTNKVLMEKAFRVIITDESHFIKNHKATRTKAALQLLKAATRVILLSGTPALSRPIELYTQICAVQPQLFPSYYEFGKRYCAGVQNRFGWDFSGASNMEELQLLLEEKIMIRRLKKDVLMQLPSKRRQLVILDSSMIKTKPLDKAARELNSAKQKEKNGALLNYFCQTCSVKTQAVTQYISDLLEGGHKFLVFAHHKEMLDSVSKFLTDKSHKFIRIDGSTSSALRQTLCDRFQKNSKHKVAVLSITAANTGLTLTEATAVVFAELFWNPGALMQAEDRAYRIGQKNSVNIHYLVAKGTADDYLWPLVQHKLEVLSQAGLGKNDFSEADNVKFEDPKQQKLFSFFEAIMEESMEDFSVEEIDKMEEQVLSNSEESYQTPTSTSRLEYQPDSMYWFDNLSYGPTKGPSSEGSNGQDESALSKFVQFTSAEPYPKRLCR